MKFNDEPQEHESLEETIEETEEENVAEAGEIEEEIKETEEQPDQTSERYEIPKEEYSYTTEDNVQVEDKFVDTLQYKQEQEMQKTQKTIDEQIVDPQQEVYEIICENSSQPKLATGLKRAPKKHIS